MIGQRALALAALLACLACSAPPRGYYAPVGAPFGERLTAWHSDLPGSVGFEVRCQGVYQNWSQGHRVRTVHLQFELTQSLGRAVVIPLRDVRVRLAGPDGLVAEPRLAECWSRDARVRRELRVEGWDRVPFDLFFDDERLEDPLPELVRVSWSWNVDGEAKHASCQFQRIAPDDPRHPAQGELGDLAFGYRDGYYLPVEASLGRRALQPSPEMRRHYVFHDPSRWF